MKNYTIACGLTKDIVLDMSYWGYNQMEDLLTWLEVVGSWDKALFGWGGSVMQNNGEIDEGITTKIKTGRRQA